MNNLRKFDTYADYSAATLNYPAVSWVVSGNTIYYAPEEPVFSGLTVYYEVLNPSIEIDLFNSGGDSSGSGSESESGGGGGSLPISMIVDGVEETVVNTWRFSTAGEHVVQYSFENGFMDTSFGNIDTITKAVAGEGITSIGNGNWRIGVGCPLYCYETTPPTIVLNAQSTEIPVVVYVPVASFDAYKADSEWELASYLRPLI